MNSSPLKRAMKNNSWSRMRLPASLVISTIVAITFVELLYELPKHHSARVRNQEFCSSEQGEDWTGKRIMFSSILRNAASVFPEYANSVIELAQCAMQRGAFVAVVVVGNKSNDGTQAVLQDLALQLRSKNIPSLVIPNWEGATPPEGALHRMERITHMRNVALENSEPFGGLRSFDAVVFSNDVYFAGTDVNRLLASLTVMRGSNYDDRAPFVGTVCASDYAHLFYDTWVAKGPSGESFRHYFPLLTQFDGWSAFSLVNRYKKFMVSSCWDGLLAVDARALWKLDGPFRTYKLGWDARGYLLGPDAPDRGQYRTIALAGSESIGSSREHDRLKAKSTWERVTVLVHAYGSELNVFTKITPTVAGPLHFDLHDLHQKSLYKLPKQPIDEARLIEMSVGEVETGKDGDKSLRGEILSVHAVDLSTIMRGFECDPTPCEIFVHKDLAEATNGNYIALVDPTVKVYYQSHYVYWDPIVSSYVDFTGAVQLWFWDTFLGLDRMSSLAGMRELPDEGYLYSNQGRLDAARVMSCRYEFTHFPYLEPALYIVSSAYKVLAVVIMLFAWLRTTKLGDWKAVERSRVESPSSMSPV